MKVSRICRVLTPKVTCVLPQRVQLLFFLDLQLRARGNRDNLSPLFTYISSSLCLLSVYLGGSAIMPSHIQRGPSVTIPSVRRLQLSHSQVASTFNRPSWTNA
jgi:hypothetical protein